MQGDPRSSFERWHATLADADDALLLVDFELRQYWLDNATIKRLTAVYCRVGGQLQVTVTDRQLTADGSPAARQFARWVEQYQLLSIRPGQPLELLPEAIPKPWGREIWYTGVEARGVCSVGAGNTRQGPTPVGRAPLPWLRAVLPGAMTTEDERPLILLKILAPAAEPVTGDLYFELHDEKREVYVVTDVDETAWPDGVGCVRYGFEPERVARSVNPQAFRMQYLAAVHAYEEVRRALDALPASSPAPARLVEREQRLRQDMDSYTHLRPLRVGDVLVVPPLLPHALQHGVRTVEFQTPVYERKILSFAQQVLTQDHWDTQSVLARMLLEPPSPAPFECLLRQDGVLVERIVDFVDFEVRRVRLEAGARLSPEPVSDYALVMVLQGELLVAGGCYGAEQALLLPRAWQDELTPANPAQPLVLLLALPRC